MTRGLDPFRFVLMAVAGWMNQRQLQVIDYLREENRVLRKQQGARRLRFSDGQRRRLCGEFVQDYDRERHHQGRESIDHARRKHYGS